MSIVRHDQSSILSQAVVHGDTVYLAGQVGTEGADIAEQCRTALAAVDRLLAAAGTDKSRILQATVWLADIGDFAAMNAVWETWIDPANPPARATGESKLAAPGFKVEFIVTAAR